MKYRISRVTLHSITPASTFIATTCPKSGRLNPAYPALILEARSWICEKWGMLKTVHSALSAIFCEHIRSLRSRANMTQRDLAVVLGREHGMVARIELGEQRVDFAEAYQIFIALGANPNTEADMLMTKFARSLSTVPVRPGVAQDNTSSIQPPRTERRSIGRPAILSSSRKR
jgi:transcriptional regulator with XRE-family HTH domain